MITQQLSAPLTALLLALALATSAASGSASTESGRSGASGQTTPAPPAARKPQATDDALSAWQTKLEKARARVRSAQSNEKITERNYTRARTRRYPRGEALLALRGEREAARAERREAERNFSTVLEQARRAAVPMGVLSPYMDFEDEMHELRPPEQDE